MDKPIKYGLATFVVALLVMFLLVNFSADNQFAQIIDGYSHLHKLFVAGVLGLIVYGACYYMCKPKGSLGYGVDPNYKDLFKTE